MSIQRIEETKLWQNTLAEKEFDSFKTNREELRSSFITLRKNISHLVTRISATLPNLTQHDISHLDALWETSDLIIGSNFPLSALESFVLGSSILIHDSCLCFEVFENGKNGLRETIEWQDIFASLKDERENELDEIIKDEADFFCLRQLHAKQAETILDKCWIDPDTGNQIFLLENQFLRKHLSNIIGLIASSHHWNIETLTEKLPNQINSLSGYPREWRIDPVKIACILRCADAIHIDNERAPDFQYALLKRSGISFNHWQAQNRLSSVDYDQSNSEQNTLLFNSTFGFKEEEAKSWFIIYDTLCLIDKEIKSSNILLKETYNITLKAQKVKGIESPEQLSQYIKAIDWIPCSAKVHVGNIEKIIENLGGEMLYGASSDLLGVVVRELIQNSRDSIQARKVFDLNFEEKIQIIINDTPEGFWLTIEDNGIGMSKRILTGPLLDFGTSFWSSNLVKDEFPGLKSSNFKSVGKFGIGFYSIFMVAQKAFVTTRNWKEGIFDLKQLKFNNGFTLRPIQTHGSIENFNSTCSTQIKILLKEDLIQKDKLVEIKSNYSNSTNFKVPLKDYFSAIVGGLDCPVYYSDEDINSELIHQSIESENFKPINWFNKISFSKFQNNPKIGKYISKNTDRLKPIIHNQKTYGFAAINTYYPSNNHNYLSLATVGGLTNTVHSRESSAYIGFFDYQPNSAKRDTGKGYSAKNEIVKEWVEEQFKTLMDKNLNGYEKYIASSSFAHFEYDPTDLAEIVISINERMEFINFKKLVELSTKIGIAFLESKHGYIDIYNDIKSIPNLALIIPLNNSKFSHLKTENGIPNKDFSILDCLYRCSISEGYSPQIERIEDKYQNRLRDKINLLILRSK